MNTNTLVKKTITDMSSDYQPLRETVQIGEVCMVFVGSLLVGFSKGDVRLKMESAGDLDWPHASTMDELIRRLYLALAEETNSKINDWVDKRLEDKS